MSSWNDAARSFGILGVCCFYLLPWIFGMLVAWRAMKALERIANAMEVRPQEKP
jgi:hypothetical protein